MKKAKLVVLRHGQTDFNKKRLMTGQLEATLTKLGEEQAVAAGECVKDIRFDKVYSSSLSRAFNTAALALKGAGQAQLPIHKRQEILEADAGDFAGRNIDTDPELSTFRRLYAQPLPGGESDKDVVARVQKLIENEVLPALQNGENIMLVCHSGTVHALDVVLGVVAAPPDDAPLKVERVPNAAPMVFEYEDGVMKNHYFIPNPVTLREEAANKNVPPKPRRNSPKSGGPTFE